MAKKKKLTLSTKALQINTDVVISGELIIKDYRITTCPRGIQIRTTSGRLISVYPICESSVIIQ